MSIPGAKRQAFAVLLITSCIWAVSPPKPRLEMIQERLANGEAIDFDGLNLGIATHSMFDAESCVTLLGDGPLWVSSGSKAVPEITDENGLKLTTKNTKNLFARVCGKSFILQHERSAYNHLIPGEVLRVINAIVPASFFLALPKNGKLECVAPFPAWPSAGGNLYPSSHAGQVGLLIVWKQLALQLFLSSGCASTLFDPSSSIRPKLQEVPQTIKCSGNGAFHYAWRSWVGSDSRAAHRDARATVAVLDVQSLLISFDRHLPASGDGCTMGNGGGDDESDDELDDDDDLGYVQHYQPPWARDKCVHELNEWRIRLRDDTTLTPARREALVVKQSKRSDYCIRSYANDVINSLFGPRGATTVVKHTLKYLDAGQLLLN
jgi:hypothetical protein